LSNVQSITKTEVGACSSETATIHWHIKQVKDSDPDIGSVTTAKLDDVVSALVPLSLTGSSHLVKTLDNPLLQGDSEDEDLPVILELSPEDYPRIEFSLSTSRGRNNAPRRVGTKMIPSSKSPLLASEEGKKHLICANL
jgi:hypothetical protein